LKLGAIQALKSTLSQTRTLTLPDFVKFFISFSINCLIQTAIGLLVLAYRLFRHHNGNWRSYRRSWDPLPLFASIFLGMVIAKKLHPAITAAL